MACPTCSTELRTDAKFCDKCGAPVSQATAAEYKQVTVLFADVVHSMDIAAAVGAERLRELMSELLDRSSAVVERYGGAVSQFTGDGIMAVFGAPISLEDHAIRAVWLPWTSSSRRATSRLAFGREMASTFNCGLG